LLATTDVVFVTFPGVELVTSTSTVHVPDAAIVPPLKLNVGSPAPGTNAGVPQPVVASFGVLATDTPAGRLSVKATPVNPAAFGLSMSIVSVLVPPITIESGMKVFVTVGARIVTVRSSLAGAALFPKSVCRSPAAIVFVCTPTVDEVTSTSIVQPPDGIVDPFA